MISDKDILFITVSLKSKWLKYSSQLVSKYFPDSEHIHIDGSNNWPMISFEWIKIITKKKQKYIVHIDEDCFITNRDELIKTINFLDINNYTISGTSDAYSYYRQNNPVAINTFFMISNRDHICDLNINIDSLKIWNENNEYKNSYNSYWKDKYLDNFQYPYEQNTSINYKEFEPYYFIFWMLKEKNRKFYYLFPEFNEYYKSINPKFNQDSKEIAIHMWYAREWNSNIDMGGITNFKRYERIEKKIIDIL
jgi:hypothetical protein